MMTMMMTTMMIIASSCNHRFLIKCINYCVKCINYCVKCRPEAFVQCMLAQYPYQTRKRLRYPTTVSDHIGPLDSTGYGRMHGVIEQWNWMFNTCDTRCLNRNLMNGQGYLDLKQAHMYSFSLFFIPMKWSESTHTVLSATLLERVWHQNPMQRRFRKTEIRQAHSFTYYAKEVELIGKPKWKCDKPLSGKPRRAVSHIPLASVWYWSNQYMYFLHFGMYNLDVTVVASSYILECILWKRPRSPPPLDRTVYTMQHMPLGRSGCMQGGFAKWARSFT